MAKDSDGDLEALVGCLLYRTQDAAVTLGSFSIAESILTSVGRWLGTLPSELRDSAPWQREGAVLWNRKGDLARATGDLAGARDAYQAALAIAQRLAAADPTNAEWQYDLAISLDRLGATEDDATRQREYLAQAHSIVDALVQTGRADADAKGLAVRLLKQLE